MLIAAFFGWWYGVGWLTLGRKVASGVQGVLQFFSVGLLAGSLFAPFRQIGAGRVQGPLGVQLRAWADRQFSRFIGAIVRLMLIMAGLTLALLYGLLGLLLMICWPLLPAMPIIGVVLMSARFSL